MSEVQFKFGKFLLLRPIFDQGKYGCHQEPFTSNQLVKYALNVPSQLLPSQFGVARFLNVICTFFAKKTRFYSTLKMDFLLCKTIKNTQGKHFLPCQYTQVCQIWAHLKIWMPYENIHVRASQMNYSLVITFYMVVHVHM